MKWFKHYTNASRSEKLNALRDKYGLEGYARYWLFVELLAEKFDGKDTTFRIHKRTLSQQLGYYRHTMSEQWLNNGQTLGLYKFHCDGDVFVIVFDKLLEIKDNHTRNLQVKNKPLAPRKDKDKEEDKDKKKEKEKVGNELPVKIVELWNSKAKEFERSKVKTINAKRKRLLERECKNFKSLDDWRKIFNVAVNTEYQFPDGRTWRCQFDDLFEKNRAVQYYERYFEMFEGN